MGMAVSGVALTSSHTALLLASACAYAGGMALNDACDAPLDRHERPERPIPSGRISRTAAFAVAAVLLALSIGLAATAGPRPFVASLLLVGAIVLYDAVAKGTAAGPPVMASCRALNVGVGIALGVLAWSAVGAAAIVFAYVLVLTLVSRFEVMTAPRPYRRAVDPQSARAELARHAGTQFDPHIVRQFLAVVSNYYRSFLSKAKRAALDLPPTVAALPPLAAFRRRGDQGPFTLPADMTRQLCSARPARG